MRSNRLMVRRDGASPAAAMTGQLQEINVVAKAWAVHSENRVYAILAAILSQKTLTTLLPHLNGKTTLV
jgi:hypothetical protein